MRASRSSQPGGRLAAARRVLGPQPDGRIHRRALRRERSALRHTARRLVDGQARFVEDLTPRRVDEYLLGTARQINSKWTGRAYWRYREGQPLLGRHQQQLARDLQPAGGIFRACRNTPTSPISSRRLGPAAAARLRDCRARWRLYQVLRDEPGGRGSGRHACSSAVPYTWSHYYGNFDQDSSAATNDANIFIGSSNIADGAGRQLWNFRDGDLRGDRPQMLKVYGYYTLNWNATAGAFLVAQSGQPWESWSYEPSISRRRRARAIRHGCPSQPARGGPTRTGSSTSTTRRTCASPGVSTCS